MRFNTTAEVIEYADRAALEDYRLAQMHNNHLNPFCTQGARNDWQRGYDGLGPRSYELPMGVEFNTIYQRGAAMRRLQDKINEAIQQT